MIKLTKEYLFVLQYFIYKAQKRQKIKQILKFQKIFYKSKSIILFILRYKSLTNFERKKFQGYLSEPIFQQLLKICILKNKIQICLFFNSKLQSKNKFLNFIENFKSFSAFTLFWDSIKKQIFSVNLESEENSLHHNIKLSYLSFFNNFIIQSRVAPSLKHIQYTFLLLLPMQNILLFDVRTKKKYILKKKSIIFKLEASYPLFHYQTFYYFYFYHHNYFIDNEKIQYHNSFYFDLLANRKQQFFFDKKKKNTKIFKKLNINYHKAIFKNNKFFYYSIIYNLPYFRQNACFFSQKLLKTLFFKDFTKICFFEIQLNNTQKQFLLLLFEPIWEAYFEITSYSNRPGRSLSDAIEFFRLNLKQQPMFLFKIYLNLFYKMFYTDKKIYSEQSYHYWGSLRSQKQKNLKNFNNFNPLYNLRTMFFCFFENIYLYGIQKKYQNYYLRTKQQIFLYQIIKIFRQNKKKNDINFYKIFYNQHFSILATHNQIQAKCKKKKLIKNSISSSSKNFKNSIKICKQFIIENCQHNNLYIYKYINIINYINEYSELLNLKSKKKLGVLFAPSLRSLKNFLIFSFSSFFFKKIKNLKKRLFGIEIKKQNFPFYLQKLFLIFPSMTNNLSKIKGVSFSMIFKDSTFFSSKNTFLYFFIKKYKKVFYNIALLDQWSDDNFLFLKKRNNNKILLKKLQYQVNNINKVTHIFVFARQSDSARCNYQILLKINLFFISYRVPSNSLNTFLDLASFHNIFLKFLLFIKNIHKIKRIKYNCIDYSLKKFFSIIYYCNFYGKFFSFFNNYLKKKLIVFLLENNDIQVIWQIFIKYGNQIFFFNSNYVFLNSFQTILKKWMILNKSFLFFYIKNNKKFRISLLFHILFYSKSFILNNTDWLIVSLKKSLNDILFKNYYLNSFSTKLLFLNNKKERKYLKCFVLDTLWSIKYFIIKQKHTLLLYKKNVNGFYLFNFFLFHKKKNNKKYISNYLFYWLFFFIKILKKFQYIESFINYYEIYHFTNQKENVWKKKKIKKILQFYFIQSTFLRSIYPKLLESCDCIVKLMNERSEFFNQSTFSSFQLFKLIFSKIFKDKNSIIKYNLIILQQKLKFYYYFYIKPSKYNIQKHLFQIDRIVKKSYNKTQEYLIYKLSKIIKNWCFYYQSLTSTIFSKYLDYLTLQILWGWACKRHNQKSKKWIKMRYFCKFKFIYPKLNDFSLKSKNSFYKNQRIIFASQRTSFITSNKQNSIQILLQNFFDKKETSSTFSVNFEKLNFSNLNKSSKKIFICLPNHADILLIKHKLIQDDRSPFDGDFIYWVTRHCYD